MKLLTLLTGILFTALMANSQTKNYIDQPHIEVNGYADTMVIPNEIYIRIVISEKDTRDRVSIEEQEQKMVNVLKGIGLDTEKDLATSDLVSNFRFYLLKEKDILKTKMYTLKVTNAVTASQVFIKLEEIGISNTTIERVEHSDIINLRNKMRTNAIVDAREKAIALTKPLNQNIGPAIHIVDADNLSQQLQGRSTGIQVRGYSKYRFEEKELPKIEFEKIRVAASINAKFILR